MDYECVQNVKLIEVFQKRKQLKIILLLSFISMCYDHDTRFVGVKTYVVGCRRLRKEGATRKVLQGTHFDRSG